MENYNDIARKVSNHIEEISISANDQKNRINLVETAVTEINSVTQKNAAQAEESASSNKVMQGLVDQARDIVSELKGIVGIDYNHLRKDNDDVVSKGNLLITNSIDDSLNNDGVLDDIAFK